MVAKILTMVLGLTLVLAVACGGAPAAPEPTAVPDPTATQAADTAPAAEPTAAPAMGETSQPTATPQMAAPPAEVEVNPGKLTVMVGDLGDERMDYALTGGLTGGRNYARIVHGFLISINERTEMVPGIASQWGLSADGLTWTFTIRKGVKFHDGSEVTAEDALWTLQHYWGPQAFEYVKQPTAATASRSMDRIELSEPDRVNLTTKIPNPDLAFGVSDAQYSFAIMPKRAELHDEEEELAYDANPIGAGFMSLEERVPASVMKFERFDEFYYQPDNGLPEDKRVNFQSLDLYLVPEEATRVAALRSGEADIVPASLTTKQQVEAEGGRIVFGQEGLVLEVRYLGCWEPQYPCHDKRVRQALDYAIDKEPIRDQLYGGPEFFQVKGWLAITPSTIGYIPTLDPRPFDPDKARQLLAEAGYPGGEGFGKLIVNTWPSTAMPFMVEGAQLAADSWKRELGLDVEVRVADETGIKKQWYGGEIHGQIMWRDNETKMDMASSIFGQYGDPESFNRYHGDPELFRITQETVQILDADKRTEALTKLYVRLRDETYWSSVGYVNIPWAVGPRVLTWQPYPLATFPSALHTITLK